MTVADLLARRDHAARLADRAQVALAWLTRGIPAPSLEDALAAAIHNRNDLTPADVADIRAAVEGELAATCTDPGAQGAA